MARTAQISKEKRQSIITLRHEEQSFRKMSRTLKVYSRAVAKTIKSYDEAGSHEDHHRKGRPRVTSAAEDKLTAPQIAAKIHVNASQSSSNTQQMFRGDCVNQTSMVELLQRNHY